MYRLSGHGTVAGAILVLGRDMVMVPKLIHPLPPTGPGTPKSPAYGEPVEEEPPTPHPMTDTWMQVSIFTHADCLMSKPLVLVAAATYMTCSLTCIVNTG